MAITALAAAGESKKVVVVGGGVVGIAYAFVLAKYGYKVVIYDRDVDLIKRFKDNHLTFYDRSLLDFLEQNKEILRNISFTYRIDDISNMSIYLVSIGTYAQGEYTDTNLLSFFSNAEARDKVFIVKSTVKPGTTRKIKELLEKRGYVYGRDFHLIYNPEFLREGSSVHDAINPSKIVAGVNHQEEKTVIERLYSFVPSNVPRIFTNWETAELIKLAQNAFLAMKISFANNLMYIAWRHGLDIDFKKLAEALGVDPRIGSYGLYPGLGFGGSCLPKDTKLLADLERETGYKLIQEVLRINEENIERIIDRLEEKYGELKGKKILVLGLSFKEDTDDLRESAALKLAKKLKEKGNMVYWYDDDIKIKREIEGTTPGDLKEKYDLVLITKRVGEKILVIDTEKFISLKAYLDYFSI